MVVEGGDDRRVDVLDAAQAPDPVIEQGRGIAARYTKTATIYSAELHITGFSP